MSYFFNTLFFLITGMISVCAAQCPIGTCENNGICKETRTSENVVSYKCDCTGTDFTGKKCEFRRGEIDFITPDRIEKGESEIFIVVLLKSGDQPRFYFKISIGEFLIFEFSESNLRSVRDYPFLSSFKYPASAKVYEFWYGFPDVGRYTCEMFILNGFDNSEDFMPFISHSKLKSVQVTIPGTQECLPKTRLNGVSRFAQYSFPYGRLSRIEINVALPVCLRYFDVTISYKWNLYRLDAQFPTPSHYNDWGIEKYADVSKRFVIFEPHELLPGNYLIQVDFQALYKHNGQTTRNSRKGFFTVEAEKPKIIIYGGSSRTANVAKTIVLDASSSIDQSYPERSDELTFSWTCLELGASWKASGAVIRLPPNTLTTDVKNYTFVVQVFSARSQTRDTESQTIQTSHIGIILTCLSNCDKVHPGDIMLVECSCPECTVQPEFSFRWEPQKNVAIDKKGSSALITIPELQGIRESSAFVFCEAVKENARAEIELKTTLPPHLGICEIEPLSGVYLVTNFTINCKKFSSSDPDERSYLQFDFYARVDDRVADHLGNKLLLYYENSASDNRYQTQATELILPFGKENNLTIVIEVTEVSEEGITSEVEQTVEVQVTIPSKEEYLQQLEELILGPDARLKSLLENGLEQEALQIQTAIVYGLVARDARMKNLTKHLRDKNKFQPLVKELSNGLTKISLNNEKAIKQIIGSLSLLSTLEFREEPEADKTDTTSLTESSTTILRASQGFRNLIREGVDLSLKDVESFGTTVAGTASRILQVTSNRGNSILEDAPIIPSNERKLVSQYDFADDISREYFLDDLTNEDEDDWGDIEFNIEHTNNEKIVELASASRDAFLALDYMMDTIAEQRAPNQEPFKFSDRNTAIHVEVQKANEFQNKEFKLQRKGTDESTTVRIPGTIVNTGEEKHDSRNVEIQISELEYNPFFDDMSAVPQTPIVYVNIKDVESHQPLTFDNRTESPIELKLPIQETTPADIFLKTQYNVTLRTLQMLIDLPEITDRDLPIQRFILPYDAQVELVIINLHNTEALKVFYALAFLKDEKPGVSHFCDQNDLEFLPDEGGEYTFVFETEKWDPALGEPAEKFLEYYIGIWPFASDDPPVNVTGENTVNASFEVYFTRTTCLFRDEDRKIWSEEGCTAQRKAHGQFVFCSCQHLSIFTASQFVLPNDLKSIILTDFDLSELGDNYVVLITVCISLTIYLVCFVLCWFWDRRIIKQFVPITIMADLSDDFEHSYYLLTVVTGNRFDAGTTANISLQIFGSCGRSQTFTLKETSLAVCRRGSIDIYLISSPKDLGNLEKIRLWHDNYGDSPSWYCSKIIVRNIKTDVESHFFVEQWLSVSHNYPKLIIQKEVGTEKDKRSFLRIFKDTMAHEFNNSHLWLSVLTRPPASSFTHCQRLSCAFAVFSSFMLLTIMFHGIPIADHRNQFEVGGLEINISTIILWIENVLFAVPIGFFVLFFFKNLREYEIPTLIIWKNKTKPDKLSKQENIFVPKVHPPMKVKRSGLKGTFYREDDGSDTSSSFSLPSTDIKEVEGWVINQTEGEGLRSYEDREPDSFIHAVKDDNAQEHLDRLHRLGRHALVHSVRETDPNSFIFSGDLDIQGVEKLIDEQLRLQAAEKGKHKQEPWQSLKKEDLWEIEQEIKANAPQQGIPLVTAEEKKESPKGLIIELCDMAPVSKRCGYLPWWCIFFAWVVCLTCIVACNYFTIIYGLNYGYLKSLDWLLAVLSSFFMSIFIVQPAKIIVLAGLKALFLRQLKKLHEDRFQFLIVEDDTAFPGRKPRKLQTFQPERSHPPLSGHETFLLKLKARRLRELRRKLMYLILYCFLLAPLIFIAHSTHGIHNYRVTENLRNMFKLNEDSQSRANIPSEAFLNIKDEFSLFGYFKLTFLPAMHPTRMYNGDLVERQRFDPSFLADFTTMLVGVARVRQLRMSNKSCETSEILKKLNSTCISDYDISKQDTTMYNALWTPIINGQREISSPTNDIWRFHPQNETGSLRMKGSMGYYDGGGYVAELGRTRRESASVMKYLKQVNWFDEYTRCIFVEFGTFTPSLNIFTSVVLMMEKGSSQGMKMTASIYPMVVLHPEFTSDPDEDSLEGSSSVAISLVLTGGMLIILLVVFIYRVLNEGEESVVTRLWFWLDFIIILSIMVSMFISNKTTDVMYEITKNLDKLLINEYISLQRGALWDQIQRVAFSVTQIFCFIRVFNILMHSSDKFLMLTLTLKLTSSILVGFSILFATLLVAFALAGNLLFGNHLEEFQTIPETFVTLAQQAMKVDFFYDLEDANRILGPVYFFCFGVFIVFITINLFVALLNQGLSQAKQITAERRHWITYWAYIKRFFKNTFARWTRKRVRIPKQNQTNNHSLDILPNKLLEMKKLTAQCIRNKLYSKEEILMHKMNTFSDDLLKGTGLRMVSKKDKENALIRKKEKKMEEMRACTAEFLRIKTESYMTPEELRKYEKYNAKFRAIKLNKLQINVDSLVEKVDTIFHGLQTEETKDHHRKRSSF